MSFRRAGDSSAGGRQGAEAGGSQDQDMGCARHAVRPLTVRSFILGIPLGQPLHWRCGGSCQPYSHAQVRVAGCWRRRSARSRRCCWCSLARPGNRPASYRKRLRPAGQRTRSVCCSVGCGSRTATLLREPFLGMRLAEAAIVARQDALAADDLSRWSDVFRGRLDGMTIPDGTRADLARLVAAYEHEARNVPGQAQAGTASGRHRRWRGDSRDDHGAPMSPRGP